MFQVSAPLRRIHAGTKTSCRSSSKNSLNASAKSRGCFGLDCPKRSQDSKQMFRCNLVNWQVANDWKSVFTQGASPLSNVFRISPLGLVHCNELLGEVRKSRSCRCCWGLFWERAFPFANSQSSLGSGFTSLCEAHVRVRSQAVIMPLTPKGVTVHPVFAARVFHKQMKTSGSVEVALRREWLGDECVCKSLGHRVTSLIPSIALRRISDGAESHWKRMALRSSRSK